MRPAARSARSPGLRCSRWSRGSTRRTGSAARSRFTTTAPTGSSASARPLTCRIEDAPMAGFFDQLLNPFPGNAQKEGFQALSDSINAGKNAYNVTAGNARDAISTNYTAALDPYMQLQPGANQAMQHMYNISGANGPAGYTQALQGFYQS